MPRGVYPMEKRSGLFKKGHPNLNTGRTWLKGGERRGAKHTEQSKQKMSESSKGRMPSNIAMLRTSMLGRRGASHPSWRGGKTDESKLWRRRSEYTTWRKLIFERDDYTCQKCKVKGGRLHPHHIESFAEKPEKRFEISNGITFCVSHHREFHKIYGRKGISRIMIEKYVEDN